MAKKADNKAKDANTFDDDSFFDSLKIEDKPSSEQSDLSPMDIFQQAIEDEKKVQAQSHTEDVDDDEEDKINWKKRYEDSVKGVEMLKDKYSDMERLVSDIKPFVPIFETMKSDPGLLNLVRDYVEDGGKTPQSIKDELNLPEDFVPDMEDVFKNPNSDSAKAFQKMVSMTANKIVNENIKNLTAQQKKEQEIAGREQQLKSEKLALKDKYKLTDKDIEDLDEWAANQKLDYEMLFKLKNLNSRDKNIISNLERDRATQRSKMFNTPNSLRSTSTPEEGKNDEDVLFDAIAKSMNRGNIFYRKE